MAEYVSDIQIASVMLKAGQSYDLQFLLPNLGKISVVGAGTGPHKIIVPRIRNDEFPELVDPPKWTTPPESYDPLDCPVPRRIDLFSPVSGFTPVASLIDNPPQAAQTTLCFDAISGVSGWWMARITNLSNQMAHCYLTVTCPSRIEMAHRETLGDSMDQRPNRYSREKALRAVWTSRAKRFRT